MKVPRVNADGKEVGGVPVVLHDAPLGAYLGWNIARWRRDFYCKPMLIHSSGRRLLARC